MQKRAHWSTQNTADISSSDELPYPYRKKTEATAMIGSYTRRKRHGVYNECCQKSCTEEELSWYCAAPPSHSRGRSS